VAARPDCLRLEAYGPFGQPVLFLTLRGDQAQAISFLEGRYYCGSTRGNTRLASLLPLNVPAGVLVSLLAAAPVPAAGSACRSLTNGEPAVLAERFGKEGGTLLRVGAQTNDELLFGGDDHLSAASLGEGKSQVVATYSDWQGVGEGAFPHHLELSLPGCGRSLRLDLSEAKLNASVADSAFTLAPPDGFKVIESP
jgi:hypothetical protein